MSIASEIQRLQTDRTAIQNALVAQGVSAASSHGFDDFAADIASISGGGSTDDWLKNGDTHLWLSITNSHQLAQQIRIRMIGTIDWGDGSAVESVSVTTYTTFTHTYAAPGKYRIDLHPTSGTFYLGGASSSYCVMGSTGSTVNYRRAALYQVEVGTSVITTLSNYAFYYCLGLKRVYIPKTITTFGYAIFYSCYSLTDITFDDSSKVTGGTSAAQLYRNCYSLTEATILSPVTSLGSNTLINSYCLQYLHCLPASPPTATSSSFTSLNSDCVIEVPSASLAAYKAATYWADRASQMVGV